MHSGLGAEMEASKIMFHFYIHDKYLIQQLLLPYWEEKMNFLRNLDINKKRKHIQKNTSF